MPNGGLGCWGMRFLNHQQVAPGLTTHQLARRWKLKPVEAPTEATTEAPTLSSERPDRRTGRRAREGVETAGLGRKTTESERLEPTNHLYNGRKGKSSSKTSICCVRSLFSRLYMVEIW